MASHFEATAGPLLGPTIGAQVTQTGGPEAPVTVNAESGKIISDFYTTGAGPYVTVVNNNRVSAGDAVVVNVSDSVLIHSFWLVQAKNIRDGAFDLYVEQEFFPNAPFNMHVNFCVLKGTFS